MFIESLVEEVYDVISKERVLILVSLDVDAICACKIVQWLFQRDHVLYTIIPIAGKDDLKRAYEEHFDKIKYYLLLNCGGNINLVEYLEIAEDTTFFVVDSHRPLDLDNVYNQDQIKILIKEGDTFDEIPDFEKLYMSEDEDDDDEAYRSDDLSDDQLEPSAKKSKTGQDSYISKRKRRRQWAQEREKIMYDYYEYSFYGSSTANVLYEMAWKLSRDNNDLLWFAILGLTEQFLHEKIDSCVDANHQSVVPARKAAQGSREKYFTDSNDLRQHVARLNSHDESNVTSINCLRITFETEKFYGQHVVDYWQADGSVEDEAHAFIIISSHLYKTDLRLRLCLYRHWSLYDSLCHTKYSACGFRIWTMKGQKKLLEFLADMGLPIVQSKELFQSMDAELRSHFRESIEASADKFGLKEMTFGSFIAQYGYRNKLCASDVVYAITAILEQPAKADHKDSFLIAMDALSRKNDAELLNGIKMAVSQTKIMVQQVRSFIDTHQVVCGGPFLYAHIPEGTPCSSQFAKPAMICKLANFTLNAYTVMARNKKALSLPFVLAVPKDSESGTCLIIGVPPMAEESPKNLFGAAFEHAAIKTKSSVTMDSFDPIIIEIKNEDRSKFFDALSAILV